LKSDHWFYRVFQALPDLIRWLPANDADTSRRLWQLPQQTYSLKASNPESNSQESRKSNE
jgi:hypothetical protein